MTNYSSNDKRFDQLREALIKISQFDFSYRIPISNNKNREDTLALLINHASIKMNQFMYQIRTEKTLYSQPKLFIILDNDKNIITHSDENFNILMKTNYPVKLAQLLSKKSLKKLNKIWKRFPRNKNCLLDFGIVDFQSSNDLISPLQVRILRCGLGIEEPNYLLFAFDPEEPLPDLSQNEVDSFDKNKTTKTSDIRNVRDFLLAKKVHDILKGYRHSQLPGLNQIASEAAASRSRIKRVFKKFYQLPIRAYDIKMRLEESLELLEGTDLKINEISRHFGFQAYSHYSNRFKQEYGVSPSQYRNNFFKK